MFGKKTARQRVAGTVKAIVALVTDLDAAVVELDGEIESNRSLREQLKADCHLMHVERGTAVALRDKLDGLV